MSRAPVQNLPGALIRALKWARRSAYVALGPFDYLARVVNGKGDFPPLHLRRYVGPLRSFEGSGAEFTAYLRLLAHLGADERVLDIGCGCGLMALHLKDFLGAESSYVGVDLHGPSINWCRKNIAPRHPNFDFARLDVRNRVFNPGGECAAEDFTFPFDDGAFDVILLKSVFTHMRPAEVGNYLKEVSRLLADGGRCLATFFLLNERQAALGEKGRNRLRFDYGEGDWRYAYKNSPESAVAYREDYVGGLVRESGLTAGRVLRGSWSGAADGLSFQDILLLRKS